MSVCMMDDSPWCSEGACAQCDAARGPKSTKQRVQDAIARGKAKHDEEQRIKREALEAEIKRKRDVAEAKKLEARLWVDQTLPWLIEEAATRGLSQLDVDDDSPDADGDGTPYRSQACERAGLVVQARYVPAYGDGYSHCEPAHYVYFVVW